MTTPYIAFLSIHQECGKSAKRTLWMRVQPRSNSLPSWERRFKAFFDIFSGNKKVPIDALLAWIRKHGWKTMETDDLLTDKYSITMLITADEFIELTYERSLQIPRIRTLREIRYGGE